jgi:hypothetical protein
MTCRMSPLRIKLLRAIRTLSIYADWFVLRLRNLPLVSLIRDIVAPEHRRRTMP